MRIFHTRRRQRVKAARKTLGTTFGPDRLPPQFYATSNTWKSVLEQPRGLNVSPDTAAGFLGGGCGLLGNSYIRGRAEWPSNDRRLGLRAYARLRGGLSSRGYWTPRWGTFQISSF
jgi:hypothetical protein